MTIAVMAIAGFAAGFVIDALIARFAREPYRRHEPGDEDMEPGVRTTLELSSERGALAMPRLLTTGAPYRTALVVTLTTALFGAVGARYGGDTSHLSIAAGYAAILIICGATDLLAYRVPNAVTYPAIVASFAIGMIIPGANRLDVAVGGLLFGGILFVPSIITGGAMGMGDVKLAFFVGFALGLSVVVPAMLIMAISGGIVATLLLVTRVRGKGDPIPYAPFICFGALWGMLAYGTAFATP